MKFLLFLVDFGIFWWVSPAVLFCYDFVLCVAIGICVSLTECSGRLVSFCHHAGSESATERH